MFPDLPTVAILLLFNFAIGEFASSSANRISVKSRHIARQELEDHHGRPLANAGPGSEIDETVTEETVSAHTQRTFQSIYRDKLWTEEGRGSGPGSTREATQITVAIIRLLAATLNASSLVDAPCGELEYIRNPSGLE